MTDNGAKLDGEAMSKIAKDDGGAAFPATGILDRDGDLVASPSQGMSLRDWFAGQALAGMGVGFDWHQTNLLMAADQAYKLADAMLLARR